MRKGMLHKVIALLVAAMCSMAGASAQFGIAPTDSLVAEFPTDSLTRIFQIDFPNESNDSLGLSWRWVGGGWTEGWDINLCDLGECYTGVPADAEMLAMAADGMGFLKLIVNALELEGTCFLHFWVWPTGNQDALVDVYFDLRNGGISNIAPALLIHTEAAQAHPVPARAGQPVMLSGLDISADLHAVQLYDMQGALHTCPITRVGMLPALETSGLTSGVYLLKLADLPPVRILME